MERAAHCEIAAWKSIAVKKRLRFVLKPPFAADLEEATSAEKEATDSNGRSRFQVSRQSEAVVMNIPVNKRENLPEEPWKSRSVLEPQR